MNNTVKEILEFVNENDIKFVRLFFCDLVGQQKNVSIMSQELERAFETGISFDGSSITGFADITNSDLLLFPDPATVSVLPWRPQQGRVIRFYCNIKNADGTSFICDARNLLKKVAKRSEQMGFNCKIGTECEFYLFKTDENGVSSKNTHDNGGYFDVSPLDKGENIRREICLCLEEMGINPEASHHEEGPGQHEIDFRYSDVLQAADNFLSFKYAVKSIAATNGLYASFMPKPFADKSGSGLHINLSLFQNKNNIFNYENVADSMAANSFIAGILEKGAEITAFLNPVLNSYDRFGGFKAPGFLSWSHKNRSQFIRIPAAMGENMRIELRSPDAALNPYLAFAIILSAGLDGIEKKLELQPPVDLDLYHIDETVKKELVPLPGSLKDAIALAEESVFVRKIVGDEILDKYIHAKREEISEFEMAKSKETFCHERYFEVI
ncbi:type I glutamate--ammonia ligase [Lachnospiraceae bacterium ZAX-1]